MGNILHVVGARPNFMKMAPVHRALARYPQIRSRILHTGQHYDRLMSEVFFEDLQLPLPDRSLGVGSGSHAEQTAAILIGVEQQLQAERPDLVVVYGDVNSTLASALACAKLLVPFAHVEAGLRSGDRSMPEEVNRIVTDRLAGLLLVTEPSGRANLLNEGVPSAAIRDTGNCMIDSLAALLEREGVTSRGAPGDRPLVLVTLHRPSNVDEPQRLDRIAGLLESLAGRHEVLFPVHPRTRKHIATSAVGARLAQHVQLVEPLRYRDFVLTMLKAALIVTDSGGVQEESAYLGVPCLTLRTTTERPITIDAGTNLLETSANGDLAAAAQSLIGRSYPAVGQNPVLRAAHWDGHAGERCAKELVEFLARSR